MATHITTRDQFRGALLGLAYGDALGAPYESGLLERFVWSMIGRTANGDLRWTDDTQMSRDVVESLLFKQGVDQDHLATLFAENCRWSRGYGPGTQKFAKLVRKGVPWQQASLRVYPDGSYGNGGAMRAPVVPLFYLKQSHDVMLKALHDITVVTHAHPLAVEGAALVALVTDASLRRQSAFDALFHFTRRYPTSAMLDKVQWTLDAWSSKEEVPAKAVVKQLGNGVSALNSCVTAVYLAERFLEKRFEQLLAFTRELHGDVDTISAMAGAIWGAWHGFSKLPTTGLEDRNALLLLADQLYDRQK